MSYTDVTYTSHLINSIRQSYSIEADSCLSDRIYAPFTKPKTSMTCSQELSLVTVLSQLNPVRNHKSCFLKIYINTIHQNKIQSRFVKLRLYLPCSIGAICESFSRDTAVTYSPQT